MRISAVAAMTPSAESPASRSARIVQPASTRPRVVAAMRYALTTSPPIDVGRQRLKNCPSKYRRMNTVNGSWNPTGRASAAQRIAARHCTPKPSPRLAPHQRQSTVPSRSRSCCQSTLRSVSAIRARVPATRNIIPAARRARPRCDVSAGRSGFGAPERGGGVPGRCGINVCLVRGINVDRRPACCVAPSRLI